MRNTMKGHSKFLFLWILVLIMSLLGGALKAIAEPPACLKIEGMSFCPPETTPPSSGGNSCSPCEYCSASGNKTYFVANKQMSCTPCVCGVNCPPGPGGEGCGTKTF